jgi:hypothetical protein
MTARLVSLMGLARKRWGLHLLVSAVTTVNVKQHSSRRKNSRNNSSSRRRRLNRNSSCSCRSQ